jgi:L-arabinokinase
LIVFYVSGHGYGHASRAGAVMDSMWRLQPDMRIAVRTQAPRMMFPDGIEYYNVQIDSAMVESSDALTIDNERSIANLRDLLANEDEIVQREVQFLRESGAKAVAADIPFLAGKMAAQAGLRSVAMGNFTWDWIFGEVAPPEILNRIREGYAAFTRALRFPLSHAEGWNVFRKVTDVPLVAPRSKRSRGEIRSELGLGDDRAAVLIGGRARLTQETLDIIKRDCPEFAFLTPDMHDSFSDLLRASDIVVAKVGYSIAAECIAEKKKLLFPPREGFREETVLLPQARQYLTLLPIPNEDWAQGRWKQHLMALLKTPGATESIRTDGADECARILFTVMAA